MPRTVEQIQFAPRMPKTLRVAAYARVSSGKDAMLSLRPGIIRTSSPPSAGVCGFTPTSKTAPGKAGELQRMLTLPSKFIHHQSISVFRNTVPF